MLFENHVIAMAMISLKPISDIAQKGPENRKTNIYCFISNYFRGKRQLLTELRKILVKLFKNFSLGLEK